MSPSLGPLYSPMSYPNKLGALSNRDAIDVIFNKKLRTGLLSPKSRSKSHGVYEIIRNGEPVCTLFLSRTSYKLGEVIYGSISLNGTRVQCYQVNVSLESFEVITPDISTRSETGNNAATRKIYSQQHKWTINCTNCSFALNIPVMAAPSFSTSKGINAPMFRLT
jgi:hypothetical protein